MTEIKKAGVYLASALVLLSVSRCEAVPASPPSNPEMGGPSGPAHPNLDAVLTKNGIVFEAKLSEGERLTSTNNQLGIECYKEKKELGRFDMRTNGSREHQVNVEECKYYTIVEFFFPEGSPEPYIVRRTPQLAEWPK